MMKHQKPHIDMGFFITAVSFIDFFTNTGIHIEKGGE